MGYRHYQQKKTDILWKCEGVRSLNRFLGSHLPAWSVNQNGEKRTAMKATPYLKYLKNNWRQGLKIFNFRSTRRFVRFAHLQILTLPYLSVENTCFKKCVLEKYFYQNQWEEILMKINKKITR